jgi:hypothetical protein
MPKFLARFVITNIFHEFPRHYLELSRPRIVGLLILKETDVNVNFDQDREHAMIKRCLWSLIYYSQQPCCNSC